MAQTCDYSGTVLNPGLAFCQFGAGFVDLDTVKVTVQRSGTLPTTKVLYLDDYKHINYS